MVMFVIVLFFVFFVSCKVPVENNELPQVIIPVSLLDDGYVEYKNVVYSTPSEIQNSSLSDDEKENIIDTLRLSKRLSKLPKKILLSDLPAFYPVVIP